MPHTRVVTSISFANKTELKDAKKKSEKRGRTLSQQVRHFFKNIERFEPADN